MDELEKLMGLDEWVPAEEVLAEMEEYQLLWDIFDERDYPPE